MTQGTSFTGARDGLIALVALLSCFVVIDQLRFWGAPLLGANGFTNGVGPANLGLSFNVNL